MKRIPSPYPGKARGAALLHTLAALAIIATVIAAACAAGLDIIGIYLATSYRTYPLIIMSLALAAALPNLALAVRCAAGSVPPPWKGIASLAVALLFCAAAVPPLRTHFLRNRPAAPSAPGGPMAGAGPLLTFGPFHDRRARASQGIIISYFDPFPSGEAAEIRYGTEPDQSRMTGLPEIPGDGRRREFHLAGLAPSRRYYYLVPALDDIIRTFVTPPAEGPGVSLRFLCVADTGNTRRSGVSRSYYGEVMRAASDWYARMHTRPSFMIHAGDIVRTGDDLEAWGVHFASFDGGGIPVVTAPGNHDYLGDRGGNHRYIFPHPDYYSLDIGDIRVISLHPYDGPGRTLDGPVLTTGKEQYRWVKRELGRKDRKRWTVVIIHNPILSTGDYGSNELLGAQYLALFRRHGVDLVISGHDHNFDAFHVDPGAEDGGTIFLVVGTGGSHLDSYIMDRPRRRWGGWRNEPAGDAYAPADPLFDCAHLYGELSWGFTDVALHDDTLTVTYCRWLDYDRFLSITGQEHDSWDMVPLDDPGIPLRAEGVKTIIKKKGPAREGRGKGPGD